MTIEGKLYIIFSLGFLLLLELCSVLLPFTGFIRSLVCREI